VLDKWRRRLAGNLTRLRNDGRAAVLWSLRITIAAVASYVVATLFFPGTQPLLAPLTAMLVVQVTPVSLLASGLDRVVAVVTGVSLAVAFAAVLPLDWWSLGLLIFVCIAIGQALRLRANLIEVAISGMLVLGVGSLSAESAAWQRIAETLVGAAVGIAANLLFPPRIATADAARAIPPGGLVLSLQNGVANADVARSAAPALQVLPGMVPYNIAEVAPGHLHRGTGGHLAAEDDPALRAWLPAFEAARLRLKLYADLRPVQWGKLLLNLNNPVNALSGLPLRAELMQRGYRQVFAALQREALAALEAAGI